MTRPQKLVFAVLLSSLLVVVVGTQSALAETVFAKGRATLHERPGESSEPIANVANGTKMQVLRRTGRWVKVRVKGRTGWVTRSSVGTKTVQKKERTERRRPFVDGRSKRRTSDDEQNEQDAPRDRIGADGVDDVDQEEVEEQTRRRKQNKKAGKKKRRRARAVDEEEVIEDEGEDEEEEFEEEVAEEEEGDDGSLLVQDRAELFTKPSRRSDSVDFLKDGDRVFPLKESKSGKWVKVETQEGEVGWLRAESLGGGAFVYPKILAHLWVSLGTENYRQKFASVDGQGEFANYELQPLWAAAVLGGGSVLYKMADRVLVGGDLGYRFTLGNPGIEYDLGQGNGNVGYTAHNVLAALKVGYQVGSDSGAAAYLRAGARYENFQVDDIDNDLYMASEATTSGLLGLVVEVPKIDKSLSARAGFDFLIPGAKRAQTAGLEDGENSSVTGWVMGGRLNYKWAERLELHGAYSYGRVKTEFDGQATRDHLATEANRTDQTHLLSLGMGTIF